MGRERKREGKRGEREEGMNELEVRMRRLEWEEERRRREARKGNLIIKGVKVEKEGIKSLKEEVKRRVRASGSVAKVEDSRRIGRRDAERRDMR